MPNIIDLNGIYSALKEWYSDKINDLFFRVSPVLTNLEKLRVQGKTVVIPVISGRGGAVSANYLTAKRLATTTTQTKAFKVKSGRVFSCYTIHPQEVLATKTDKGAFMKATGIKMSSATNGFRQYMAAALYGSGWGELHELTDALSITAGTPVDIELPYDVIVKIDVDQELEIKSKFNDTTVIGTVVVKKIDGNKVSLDSADGTTAISAAAGSWLCLEGCIDTEDGKAKPALPVGLGGWLPDIADRNGADWEAYIAEPFFEVDRSINPSKLAGNFYKAESGVDHAQALKVAVKLSRRQGGKADLIVLNDDDMATLADVLETTNMFFTQTSTAERKEGTTGFNRIAAAFSTNFVQNIWDDPYCPKGKFYVLTRDEISLMSYTDADKPLATGIDGNNAGKQDPMTFDEQGKGTEPYQLLLDDYLAITGGVDTPRGPCALVSLMFFGAFAIFNPANCVVGKFAE